MGTRRDDGKKPDDCISFIMTSEFLVYLNTGRYCIKILYFRVIIMVWSF